MSLPGDARSLGPSPVRRESLPGKAREGSLSGDTEFDGPDPVNTAITSTMAHELAIHGGRAAMGLDTGHARGGYHATRTPNRPDNRTDEEAHYVLSVFGASRDNLAQNHRSERPEFVRYSEFNRIPPPRVPDVSTYRFEGP